MMNLDDILRADTVQQLRQKCGGSESKQDEQLAWEFLRGLDASVTRVSSVHDFTVKLLAFGFQGHVVDGFIIDYKTVIKNISGPIDFLTFVPVESIALTLMRGFLQVKTKSNGLDGGNGGVMEGTGVIGDDSAGNGEERSSRDERPGHTDEGSQNQDDMNEEERGDQREEEHGNLSGSKANRIRRKDAILWTDWRDFLAAQPMERTITTAVIEGLAETRREGILSIRKTEQKYSLFHGCPRKVHEGQHRIGYWDTRESDVRGDLSPMRAVYFVTHKSFALYWAATHSAAEKQWGYRLQDPTQILVLEVILPPATIAWLAGSQEDNSALIRRNLSSSSRATAPPAPVIVGPFPENGTNSRTRATGLNNQEQLQVAIEKGAEEELINTYETITHRVDLPFNKTENNEEPNPTISINEQTAHSYYMGVDVGTGSARVCLVDAAGVIKAVHSKETKTWNPSANYYEQSTADIWSAISYCSHKVLEESAIDPSLVKGIGFDATCSLAVFDNVTNEPISVAGPDFTETDRNVILWMDHRPEEETKIINATNHNLLKYVGGSMSIEMEIPKVLWLKKNMPPGMFERSKFYDLVDALTYLATGKETRSYCSTVCKQGFVPVGVDGSVKGWQDDFLTEIGLGDLVADDYLRIGGVNGKNGHWLSAGQVVGELCETSAADLGLKPGVKIGSGVIDAYAGWVGTVGAKVDMGSESPAIKHNINAQEQVFHRLAAVAGTSTCHLVMSKDPVFVPGVWGPYRDVLLPGRWLAEGGQSSTGSLLHNVLTTHPSHQAAQSAADTASLNLFEYLNRHLDGMRQKKQAPSISYLARHIFFYGDKHGNRSPIADPEMRGAIVGLSMDSSVDDLALQYYAAMEFIAQQTRHIIDTLNKEGHQIKAIFMSGGQCKNSVLMELIASATGFPVCIPTYIDAAVVLGAAMLGAKAASENSEGDTEDLWTIMGRMSQPGKIVRPTDNQNERKLLEAKYKVFLEMAEAQKRYRNIVDEAGAFA